VETRGVIVSIAKQLIDFDFRPPYSDVTSEDSLISFNVYDRVAEHLFLGTVQIKPILIHDHTVDQWYKYVVISHTVLSQHSFTHVICLHTGSGRSRTK